MRVGAATVFTSTGAHARVIAAAVRHVTNVDRAANGKRRCARKNVTRMATAKKWEGYRGGCLINRVDYRIIAERDRPELCLAS